MGLIKNILKLKEQAYTLNQNNIFSMCHFHIGALFK